MGLLGRYVDSLPGEAKDRIIRAQDWDVEQIGGSCRWTLLDHAEGCGWKGRWAETPTERLHLRMLRILQFGIRSRWRIQRRAVWLARRCGRRKAVRLLKRRAAKHAFALESTADR